MMLIDYKFNRSFTCLLALQFYSILANFFTIIRRMTVIAERLGTAKNEKSVFQGATY